MRIRELGDSESASFLTIAIECLIIEIEIVCNLLLIIIDIVILRIRYYR